MAKRHALFTIGYEKAGFDDFAFALRQAGVTHVLDVRDLPLSRRAGFSKRQLAAGLEEKGIAYTHMKGLGTPKAGRTAAHTGHRDRFWKIFAAHMRTKTAQDALHKAAEMVKAEPCCLLCLEADPTLCHRCVVAEKLKDITGMKVNHLHIAAI